MKLILSFYFTTITNLHLLNAIRLFFDFFFETGVRIACGKLAWSRDPLRTTDQGGNNNIGGGVYGQVHLENTGATGGKTKVEWQLSGLSSDAPYHAV